MGLFNHVENNTYSDSENLAYPPDQSSPLKVVCLGIALPLYLLWCAADCWFAQEFNFHARGSSSIKLRGACAQAFAAGVGFLGLFCFTRWWLSYFFGYRIFVIFSYLSLLGVGAAMLAGLYFMVR